MTSPVLVLAAHGTRDPEGPEVLAELASVIATEGGVEVWLAFVDVIAPTVADVLTAVDRPVIVVPAFLATGYHVHTDLPQQVRECARDDVVIAQALGPDPRLAGVAFQRLVEAGWRAGDAVVLASAGSSDGRALADVRRAGTALARLTGDELTYGYVASAQPEVPEAVRSARRAGARRVAIASWLLAPGLFQQRLGEAGADVVASPLGVHPQVAAAVTDRYRSALT